MTCPTCGSKCRGTSYVMHEGDWVEVCSQRCAESLGGVRLQKVGDEVWEMSW